MRVEPTQLVPGCVLIKGVKGKTSKDLIPQKTTLTEEHITVLKKFLVPSVEIAAKLATGEMFEPSSILRQEGPAKEKASNIENSTKLSVKDLYNQTVEEFKKLFSGWQNGVPLDLPAVRKLMIPLLERLDEWDNEVFSLSNLAISKDYFYHHCVAVGIISAYIGRKMGYRHGEYLQIGLAGFLSDSGMAKIDSAIIVKKGSLTHAEMASIKKHPTYSYRFVENSSMLTKQVKLAILQHHERMDGSGYPLGLTQKKIHMYARIIAVADQYHAMTCSRPYQDSQSSFHVVEQLQKDQYLKLDPRVVHTFMEGIANFSNGSRVQLSDLRTGEIVFIEPNQPTRPIIKIDGTEELISLQNNPSLYIQAILSNKTIS
ncbi:HD-GYP domain-containing protein [Virgibacillus halodenitrificans]|uniref:HD-GYP domain-containing protein n=1 Tax=Virgibacillus halodenitrificans TaxID=1482 RepID=UPI0024C010BF|nr:HD-GYP domain-containing protein [Virgibacillus halodenitrificans]WHX25573.1 HD-GYP domain-containing protein [Virgibacillus halodenitrificans]